MTSSAENPVYAMSDNKQKDVDEMKKNMRVGIISDLHVDENEKAGKPVVETLLRVIGNSGVDAVLIAGDVSNDYRETLAFFNTIERESGISCYHVPGNHDLWNEAHPHKNAWDIYHELLSFKGNLANGPVELPGGWVLLGDVGWYDYSFGGKEISREEFDKMQFEGRIWQDKIKAIWDRSTLEMHQYFLDKLEAQLKRWQHHKLILMTHVVPHPAFTVQKPNAMWRYLNAFLGSTAYGSLAQQYQVEYAVFGHVHYRMTKTIDGTTYACRCLGTYDEWDYFHGKTETKQAVEDAFEVIELG